MNLSAAFSPCPNDIFLFWAFLQRLEGFPIFTEMFITDISRLNKIALDHESDLIKTSAALFPALQDHYDILPVGNILGYGVGPLLFSHREERKIDIIATPGETTTAHTLCRMFYPEAQLVPMLYHEIIPAILQKKVSAGVVIHEERFISHKDLVLICDLGTAWEQATNLPLPLGCLLASKQLSDDQKQIYASSIHRSLTVAMQNRDAAAQTALEYSRQNNLSMVHRFIDVYINEETFSLSQKGEQALETLWSYSLNAKIK